MGHIRDRWKDLGRAGKGARWQVKYQVDGRERDGGSYVIKAAALRRLTELEAAALRGQFIDPTLRITVARYAREWAGAQPHKPATARRVESQIRQHIEGRPIGARRLVALRPSEVQTWASELARELAPSTVRLQVTLLSTIYLAAVRDGLVAASPVERPSLPRAEKPRIVPLSVAQVRALTDAVPPRNRAMILVQAGLGLRVGELLALRQQDVSFLGRSVRIEHQLDERTRERIDPKTPRSRRTVPLPSMVGEVLARHIAQFPPLGDGSLFSGASGRLYAHADYTTRIFKAAVRELAEGSTFPAAATTHALRHHYASVLLAAGESVVAVAERLGHDNATMVLRVYGHLLPDSEDRTRRAVDDAWAAPADSRTAHTRPGRS